MEKDAEQVRLLSILHYVFAGFTAVFACLPLFYIGFAFMMLRDAGRSGGPPAFVGILMVVLGFVAIVFALAMAALAAYAGKCLSDRKNYTFCIVIAALSCLSFPFGTALGIFTIIVLQRPAVRAMFGKPV